MEWNFYSITFGGLIFFQALLTMCSRNTSSDSKEEKTTEFTRFQRNYLVVYLLAMFADWLKGPYVYALYDSYGYNPNEIAILFVSGFVASLLIGTWVAALADNLGRKKMCIAFGLIYIGSAVVKPINNFWVLLLGRVLSGIATSLLFSSFEAWMVTEHKARNFSPSLLSNTYTLATMGNGAVAVIAGLVSEAVADRYGYVGPFLFALIPLTLEVLIVSFTWKENYGDSTSSTLAPFYNGYHAIRNDPRVFYLGCAQSLFEGAMYTWVFAWTPAIQTPETKDHLPYGLMFASFMACVMVGSSIFAILIKRAKVETIPTVVHILAAVGMSVPLLFFDSKHLVYLGFLLFEIACGIFFPTYGTIRSQHLEEESRASVMSFFRIPLNGFVVAFLMSYAKMTTGQIYGVLTATHIVGFLCFRSFFSRAQQRDNLTQPPNIERGLE